MVFKKIILNGQKGKTLAQKLTISIQQMVLVSMISCKTTLQTTCRGEEIESSVKSNQNMILEICLCYLADGVRGGAPPFM